MKLMTSQQEIIKEQNKSEEEKEREREEAEKKEMPKPKPSVTELFVKGKRIELEVMERLGVLLIPSRKEVKNTNLVKNFVHSYEDRYICMVDFN